jgi:hypothetical protein
MPVWLWLIVVVAMGYGLYEVGMREGRAVRTRVRRMRGHAERIDFAPPSHDHHRELNVLLVLVADQPGHVAHPLEGHLSDGTPVAVFDFDEDSGTERPVPLVGFALRYPTDWPTIDLASPRDPAGRHAADFELSGALLASDLCEYLAAQRDWWFSFSGPFAFGATGRGDGDDLGRVLAVAEGVAARLPVEVITGWPATEGRHRRAS